MNFELLPIVNSKKQYIGIVCRKDLEALYKSGSESATPVDEIQSENTPAPAIDNKIEMQQFTDKKSQDKVQRYWDAADTPEDEEALERTLLLRRTGLVVYSEQMMNLIDLAIRVAKVDSTVLISGESGVGKELLAKLIHDQSTRSLGPFVKINCGAIPENLLESELFGYEAGAFTGASKQGKLGMFELATGGTLFLDEIGELPLSLQVKLLRAIQEQEFVRVGGVKPRKVDIRFIAATNRDLEQMVVAGQFRDDLYYRLNVIPMLVPPLRQRKEDILPLVHHFQQKFTQRFKTEKNIVPEVLRVFLEYTWAGNVRELENIIERLFVTSKGKLITMEDLPEKLMCSSREGKQAVKIIPLKEALEETEQRLINEALQVYGNTYKAAEALGINQSTLSRKQAKFREKP